MNDGQTNEQQLIRARRTALVLATAVVISILFVIYAFTQKLVADKQRVMLEQALIQAQGQEKLAKACEVEAIKQKMLAEEVMRMLQECQNKN